MRGPLMLEDEYDLRGQSSQVSVGHVIIVV